MNGGEVLNFKIVIDPPPPVRDSRRQTFRLVCLVRGGITLAHLATSYSLACFPGTDLYTPSICGDDLDDPGGKRRGVAWFFFAHLIITLFLYWSLCLSDPGVTGSADGDVLPVPDKPLAEITVDPEAMVIGGVCRYCRQIKLLRTKHCRACGRCCRRMDHHCDWACNCVGFKNNRVFILYIMSQMSFLLFATGEIITGFVREPRSDRLAIPIVSLILAVLAVLFVGILLKMHAGFMVENATTYETYRGFRIPAIKEPQDDNPYNVKSPWQNIVSFWTKMPTHVDTIPTNWRAPF